MRISSAISTRNGGWLHHLIGVSTERRKRVRGPRTIYLSTSSPGRDDLDAVAAGYRKAITPSMIEVCAAALGVTTMSLDRLGIGWAYDAAYRRGPNSLLFDAGDILRVSAASATYSFPMCDATGEVLGIRLRASAGEKWSVSGGHEGLFIPRDLPQGGELLITEGPTDCATLLDLGFAAVGRPSCTGGVKLLVELAQQQKPSSVIIVADADAPGERGANALASVLSVYVRCLQIITPPIGVKDARAWKQAGATAAEVRAAIDAAPIRQLNITGCKAKEACHE